MGKKCKKPNLMVMLLGAGVVLSMTGCSDSKSQAIIEKIDIATDMTHDTDAGNRYLFDYDDQWEINYNKDAQTVRFVESAVEDCICSFAGIDYIGDNANIVIYDWNDNAYHTNVEYIDEDGDHVSMIKYSIDDDEWSIMADDGGESDWYDASDDFLKDVDDYGLVEILNGDLKQFKSILKDSDLSLDDLKYISFDDVDRYYSDN